MAHSQKTKDEFIGLRAQGVSYSKIAMQLRVSRQTLVNWNRQFSEQIQEMKASRMAELAEKWLQEKERRVELFAEQLSRMQDELAERDLSEISTAELLRLYLRYLDTVSRVLDGVQMDVR